MKIHRLFTIAVMSLCAGVCFAEKQEGSVDIFRFEPKDAERDRIVPLKVYCPDGEGPLPVVLFSHGLGGSRENNSYLGTYWAKGGFVAVFMQHTGSDEIVWKSAPMGKKWAALKKATTVEVTLSRLGDVPFVIDELERWNKDDDHPLRGKLDLEHIGLSGHSFGAVTTLALAGQKFPRGFTAADPRVDAFLAMSPQSGKGFSAEQAFGHIQVPILCMTGTKDGSPLDPDFKPSDRLKVYAALPEGDKYQLILKGAEHWAFGSDGGRRKRDRNPSHHPAVQQISLRFWEAYLKGDKQAKVWLKSERPTLESGLGESDVWQWK